MALTESRRATRVASAAPNPPTLSPPLKWAGGKRWQIPYLLAIWRAHSHRRLVEPFCGGLAVALGLSPTRALLNDANPHLINFYRWLQRGLVTDVEMANDESLFNRQRARFNELLQTGGVTTAEAASLFYFLNRTGYNGLCRFNKQGEFNVPFGRYNTHQIQTRLHGRMPRGFATGNSRASTSPNSRRHRTISSTPTRRTTLSSPPMRKAASPGTIRRASLNISRDTPDRSCWSISPRNGLKSLYRSLGYAIDHLDAPRRISCTGDRRPAREVVAVRNLT